MAKTTTRSSSKTRKLQVEKIDDESTNEPVWSQDEVLTIGAKPFSESLKRIGEQAKDWEEVPRARLRVPQEPTSENKPNRMASSVTITLPKWTIGVGLTLLILLATQMVWLSWHAMTLNRSLGDLNNNVKSLTDKVATWSDAETPAAP